MVLVNEIRTDLHYTQVQFAKELAISYPTLARIEAAEQKGTAYTATKRTAKQIASRLSALTNTVIAVSDLEGIVVAPPRPGRPKKT